MRNLSVFALKGNEIALYGIKFNIFSFIFCIRFSDITVVAGQSVEKNKNAIAGVDC